MDGISPGKAVVITITLKREFNGGGTITLTPSAAEGKLEWKCSATLPRRALPGTCRQ